MMLFSSRQQQRMVWTFAIASLIVIGMVGCNSLKGDRNDSPTGPEGSALELGNYSQQSGQSRVVTVNGATHQLNGVISGGLVGGLYIEINEQSSTGQPAGTDQVPVSLQDVKITVTGLSSGVSAIKIFSGNDSVIGQYAVSDGSVEILLTAAQWTQWFGLTHYAAVCEAVGSGRLSESMVAVSGRLPSGEVVTFGKGFTSSTPTSSPGPPVTCNPNNLPVFVDNGNGTVTDTSTGLIWLQDANCNSTQTWTNAGIWAAGLASGSCGLTDGSTAGQWRLPTVAELQELIDYSQSYPALPVGHPFTNVQAGSYWTSTDFTLSTSLAWSVGIHIGEVGGSIKSSTAYAWAVR